MGAVENEAGTLAYVVLNCSRSSVGNSEQGVPNVDFAVQLLDSSKIVEQHSFETVLLDFLCAAGNC
mgnify:CR=1 FL=1